MMLPKDIRAKGANLYMGKLSELSKKVLYCNSMIHICDNRRVEIENCTKILEYNDICVRVKTTTCNVAVWGTELCVDDFCTGGIVINGRISTIELEKVI